MESVQLGEPVLLTANGRRHEVKGIVIGDISHQYERNTFLWWTGTILVSPDDIFWLHYTNLVLLMVPLHLGTKHYVKTRNILL